MRPIFVALYAEGKSDERFLTELIGRTIARILHARERYPIDIITPEVIRIRRIEAHGEEEYILVAARRCKDHDLLMVHLDAGAPNRELALKHRFDLGLARVQTSTDPVCRHLVPVIPIREIEVWMIADLATLIRLINPGMSVEQSRREAPNDLTLAHRPHEVEADHEPKQTLKQIIRIALGSRRRRIAPQELPVQLGAEVRPDVLDSVPSYSQFVTDLTVALVNIGVAKSDNEL